MTKYTSHGQTDPSKPGPRPKKIVEGVIKGIAVGRDKSVVPPDQVQELAALGCKNHEICNFFGISEGTLRYNFNAELTKGRELLKISLRKAMLNNACHNMNAAVQIFLAKNFLGMADSPLNSEDAAPLPWVDEIDNTLENDGEHDEDTQ
jgi:hypothetical protein